MPENKKIRTMQKKKKPTFLMFNEQAMLQFFLLCGDYNLYRAVTLQEDMCKEFYSVLEPLCLMQT